MEALSQKPSPQNTEAQHDAILAECHDEWVIWSPLKRRVERSKGLDAKLNGEYGVSYDIMDGLLDRLGGLALDGSVEVLETGHVA